LLLCPVGVTIRIETIRRSDSVTIRLVGRLEAECLPQLKAQIEAEGPSLVLEMDDVTLVDLAAVRFLIDCEAQNIELRGYPPYIREWMVRERAS
jgi:anti-anti-sigma regulatory factor